MIKNESDISQSENINLNSILKKHPYFQSARALYLKGLKNQDSFKYNKELKITAAYTNDRSILFEYITSKSFNEVKKDFNVDSLSNNSIPDSKNSDSINKTCTCYYARVLLVQYVYLARAHAGAVERGRRAAAAAGRLGRWARAAGL